MKPVIGITKMNRGFVAWYLGQCYIRSLRRAGAEVRWLDFANPDQAAADALTCDGLLLPGGVDIDPKRYGQTRSEVCGESNSLRDEAEFKILEAFLPTNKPIFCICRGMQLLNVHFGGTLYQDIKKLQVKKHSHYLSMCKGCHEIKTYPHTRLSRLYAGQSVSVNSLHHQAVDRVGLGLTVAAVSEDAFIEALEVVYHPFCLGVQWHPEIMSKNHPQQQKLFDEFVAACK